MRRPQLWKAGYIHTRGEVFTVSCTFRNGKPDLVLVLSIRSWLVRHLVTDLCKKERTIFEFCLATLEGN